MGSGVAGPRIGELFAGAGGIGMGLKSIWPDASVSWVSDIKPGACKVLAHRFPDAPNLGDITKIDWSQVEPVDIITGGSPCQDLSHAGKRAGMKPGTRSGLWASMCDAIDILRPSLVVWENVRGALSAEATTGDLEQCEFCMDDHGAGTMRALGRVLGDLADIGYDAAWVGLRAADVGAPHGRFRVFVLAWPADANDVGRERGWTTRDRRAGLADSGHGDVALPTPRATDGTKGGPNQRGSKGDLMLPSAVALLRTPMADEDGGGPLHPDAARERGQTLRLTGQILAMTGDLLPTPAVNDMGAGKTVEHWDEWTEAMKAKHGNGNGHGKSLSIEAQRLHIEGTDDELGEKGRPNQNLPGLRGDVREEALQREAGGSNALPGESDMLPVVRERESASAGRHLPLAGTQAQEAGPLRGMPRDHETAHSPQGQGRHEQQPGELSGALRELPYETALAGGSRGEACGDACGCGPYGQYAPAIHRWEGVLGRPAPSPTEATGREGKPRLSSRLTEFMMGWPAGWVTDVPDVTRNEALSICGDGVVPQQAEAAVRHLLQLRDTYARAAA